MKTTWLYRYLQSAEYCYPKHKIVFRDKRGKLTIAKYKLVGIIKGNLKDFNNYVYKLDARSIRYMKRVRIIENRKKHMEEI